MHIDQLSISIKPLDGAVQEGHKVQLTATAHGINMNNFVYQWNKRDSDRLPDKVSGVNEIVLMIPNVTDSDEGDYYCIVTNEWGNSKTSDDVSLSVTGMSLKLIWIYIHNNISFIHLYHTHKIL